MIAELSSTISAKDVEIYKLKLELEERSSLVKRFQVIVEIANDRGMIAKELQGHIPQ